MELLAPAIDLSRWRMSRKFLAMKSHQDIVSEKMSFAPPGCQSTYRNGLFPAPEVLTYCQLPSLSR